METFSHVPPGFRFHPTDEELVDYYLRKKVNSRRIDLDVIKDVDLYKVEPWDLQELCRIGVEEQNEWYFFSHKDKKYPTGTRTNRATAAGFWKATGRDKAIYARGDLVGMRKTLVFYKGRAPNGHKSDWIMHEYRLETDENGTPQEEGWVVCRVFKKRLPNMRKVSEHESGCWYDDQVSSFMQVLDSPNQNSHHPNHHHLPYHHRHHHHHHHLPNYSCKKELDLHYQLPHDHFLQLPLLQSPRLLHTNPPNVTSPPFGLDINTLQPSSLTQEDHHHHVQHTTNHDQSFHSMFGSGGTGTGEQAVDDQVTDWRVLDKFVASQLSQGEINTDHRNNNEDNNVNSSNSTTPIFHESVHSADQVLVRHLNNEHESAPQQENVSTTTTTTTSSSQIDLWK